MKAPPYRYMVKVYIGIRIWGFRRFRLEVFWGGHILHKKPYLLGDTPWEGGGAFKSIIFFSSRDTALCAIEQEPSEWSE